MSVVNDRRGGEPGRGEEGGVLPRALVPGGRQPLFLLQGEETASNYLLHSSDNNALPSGCSHEIFTFFFFSSSSPLSSSDPAEETGAGTGLSCAQHLNQGPPEPLHLITELCVRMCVWMCV